jgi:hypothetical protein
MLDDVIDVPRGGCMMMSPSQPGMIGCVNACSRENSMAVELVTEHLKVKLRQHPLVRQYPNLECMESSPIIKQMHTIIRDKNTPRADFVFYADRLIRLVVEAGLGYLPFGERCITTPEGYQYVGVNFARRLCGVSIIRSGEAMEIALRDCCQGIKIGKVLVHRDFGEDTTSDLAGGSGMLQPTLSEFSLKVRCSSS